MAEFVNWEAFRAFYEEHDISIAVTEFGGHPTERCAQAGTAATLHVHSVRRGGAGGGRGGGGYG